MCATVRSFLIGSSSRSLCSFTRHRAVWLLLVGFILALPFIQNSTAIAEGTVENSVRGNLLTFEKLAISLCQSVPTKSSKEELSLSLTGKAELSKLIKILAGIDAEIEFDVESDKTTGILQRDLAKVIIHSNNCRLEVLRIVIEFVKSHISQDFPKLQGNNSNSYNSTSQDESKYSRVKEIIKALDHMLMHDVADYLLSVVPRIKDGITCSEMQLMMKKSNKSDRLRLGKKLSSHIRRPLPENCLSELAALVSKYNAKELLMTITK